MLTERRNRLTQRLVDVGFPYEIEAKPDRACRPPRFRTVTPERKRERDVWSQAAKSLGLELETKARVMHVRTPAGRKKFGQEIGTVIIPGPNGNELMNNIRERNYVGGWAEYEAANGRRYWVGKDPDVGDWVAVNKNDTVLHTGKTEAEVLQSLNTTIKPRKGHSWTEVRKMTAKERLQAHRDRLQSPFPAPATRSAPTTVQQAVDEYGVGSRMHEETVRKIGLPDLIPQHSRKKAVDVFLDKDGREYYVAPDPEADSEFFILDRRGNVIKDGYPSKADALLGANKIAHDTVKAAALRKLRNKAPDTEEERAARLKAQKEHPNTGLAAIQRLRKKK